MSLAPPLTTPSASGLSIDFGPENMDGAVVRNQVTSGQMGMSTLNKPATQLVRSYKSLIPSSTTSSNFVSHNPSSSSSSSSSAPLTLQPYNPVAILPNDHGGGGGRGGGLMDYNPSNYRDSIQRKLEALEEKLAYLGEKQSILSLIDKKHRDVVAAIIEDNRKSAPDRDHVTIGADHVTFNKVPLQMFEMRDSPDSLDDMGEEEARQQLRIEQARRRVLEWEFVAKLLRDEIQRLKACCVEMSRIIEMSERKVAQLQEQKSDNGKEDARSRLRERLSELSDVAVVQEMSVGNNKLVIKLLQDVFPSSTSLPSAASSSEAAAPVHDLDGLHSAAPTCEAYKDDGARTLGIEGDQMAPRVSSTAEAVAKVAAATAAAVAMAGSIDANQRIFKTSHPPFDAADSVDDASRSLLTEAVCADSCGCVGDGAENGCVGVVGPGGCEARGCLGRSGFGGVGRSADDRRDRKPSPEKNGLTNEIIYQNLHQTAIVMQSGLEESQDDNSILLIVDFDSEDFQITAAKVSDESLPMADLARKAVETNDLLFLVEEVYNRWQLQRCPLEASDQEVSCLPLIEELQESEE